MDALAQEIAAAYAGRRPIDTPTSRDASFDVARGYAVEAELARMRRDAGHTVVGVKVGFANKAMWRVLKLDTLVWARMYDDTVRYAPDGAATLAVGAMIAPKIEPEIVFKMKRPLDAGADAAAALDAVEWLAIGFEIIDCAYPDWKFQPADFVAAYGLHAALVVGASLTLTPAAIPDLVERLPQFKVKLLQGDAVVAEGSGKNSLRSPALCLAELASSVARTPDAEPLTAGSLVSSGTLTESQPIAAGQTWRVEVDGLDLAPLALAIT